MQLITLAAGCFWCYEPIFSKVKGVSSVEVGYCGGNETNFNYFDVAYGETSHAEAFQVEFDDEVVSLEDIHRLFFAVHDPTSLNKQGYDVGPQYRSEIFYRDEKQKETALKVMSEVAKDYDKPIVTKISNFQKFYRAEDYHQNYYIKNPNAGYCSVIIAPKIKKARERFRYLFVN